MTWQEKIRRLDELLEVTPELAIVYDRGKKGAAARNVTKLLREYPWLDPEYVAFLREFNGLQADMNVLYTLYGTGCGLLLEEHKSWSEPEHWDPPENIDGLLIGADADGGKYVLGTNRHIRLEENLEDESATVDLASDFATFMNDYLLGRGYADLFLSRGQTTEWTDVLASEGWL